MWVSHPNKKHHVDNFIIQLLANPIFISDLQKLKGKSSSTKIQHYYKIVEEIEYRLEYKTQSKTPKLSSVDKASRNLSTTFLTEK